MKKLLSFITILLIFVSLFSNFFIINVIAYDTDNASSVFMGNCTRGKQGMASNDTHLFWGGSNGSVGVYNLACFGSDVVTPLYEFNAVYHNAGADYRDNGDNGNGTVFFCGCDANPGEIAEFYPGNGTKKQEWDVSENNYGGRIIWLNGSRFLSIDGVNYPSLNMVIREVYLWDDGTYTITKTYNTYTFPGGTGQIQGGEWANDTLYILQDKSYHVAGYIWLFNLSGTTVTPIQRYEVSAQYFKAGDGSSESEGCTFFNGTLWWGESTGITAEYPIYESNIPEPISTPTPENSNNDSFINICDKSNESELNVNTRWCNATQYNSLDFLSDTNAGEFLSLEYYQWQIANDSVFSNVFIDESGINDSYSGTYSQDDVNDTWYALLDTTVNSYGVEYHRYRARIKVVTR